MARIVKLVFFPILTIFLLLVGYYFFIFGRHLTLFNNLNLKMVTLLQRPIGLDKALSLAKENCKIMPDVRQTKDFSEVIKQNQRYLQKVGITMVLEQSYVLPSELEDFASFPNPENKSCRVALVKLSGRIYLLSERQYNKITIRKVRSNSFESAKDSINAMAP